MKTLVVSFFCAIFLFGCQSSQERRPAGKPTVLVSIVPYAYFVERIAQDSVNIELLVPTGVDPHSYEPTPKQVQAAHNAKLWVRIGEPFEEKVLKVLQEQPKPLQTIEMWQEMPLLRQEEACCHAHTEEALDKHVWLSPRLAKIQAERLEKALVALFPEKQVFFEQNLHLFLADLDKLDNEISSLLSPVHDRAFVVSHPAFGYFCRDYNLLQLSIEGEGKEALPQEISAMLKEAKKTRAHCVITAAQYSSKAARLVSSKLRLPVFQIDPYAKDYLKNLYNLAAIIADASSEPDRN